MHDGDEFDELEKLKELDSGTRNNEELGVFVRDCGQQVLMWERGKEIKESVTNKET